VTLRYLLDTNVLSEPLKPQPNPPVMLKLAEAATSIATAAVVWHELQFGAARLRQSRRRRLIESYLVEVVRPSVPILPYDERAAHWHAVERARLVAAGRTPPFVDGQIAAIAVVNQLVLVTANVADYSAFSELNVEDWRG
jgi:tRNA(fMet)-specific endonuclease VapC